MNKKLFNVNIVLYSTIYTMRARLRTNKYPVLAKNDILGLWLIVCCKHAPTSARQMWRHNDVIGRNEYL